jgi:hypothetical protein
VRQAGGDDIVMRGVSKQQGRNAVLLVRMNFLSYFVAMRGVSKQQGRNAVLLVRKLGSGVGASEEQHGRMGRRRRPVSGSSISSTDLCGACGLAGINHQARETHMSRTI